jgi:hypothetical protein
VVSPYGPQTNNPSKSVLARALGTSIPSPLASLPKGEAGYAGNAVWLAQAANSSGNSDQQRKKDVAILAFDAVFAEYAR